VVQSVNIFPSKMKGKAHFDPEVVKQLWDVIVLVAASITIETVVVVVGVVVVVVVVVVGSAVQATVAVSALYVQEDPVQQSPTLFPQLPPTAIQASSWQ